MGNPEEALQWQHAAERVLGAARERLSALMRAMGTGDVVAAAFAAEELGQHLLEASDLLDGPPVSHLMPCGSLRHGFVRATEGMRELLRRAPQARPVGSRATAFERLVRSDDQAVSSGRSQVMRYDSNGESLDEILLVLLHVAQSRFITSMRRAIFGEALIEACDFTFSNLQQSSWYCTHVRGSCLRGCSLVDAAFDRTMFTRCDLRESDLRTSRDACTPFDVTFIECDLRGARWDGRDLAGATFVSCEVDSVRDDLPEPAPAATAN